MLVIITIKQPTKSVTIYLYSVVIHLELHGCIITIKLLHAYGMCSQEFLTLACEKKLLENLALHGKSLWAAVIAYMLCGLLNWKLSLLVLKTLSLPCFCLFVLCFQHN